MMNTSMEKHLSSLTAEGVRKFREEMFVVISRATSPNVVLGLNGDDTYSVKVNHVEVYRGSDEAQAVVAYKTACRSLYNSLPAKS